MKSAVEKKDLNWYRKLNSEFHAFFFRKSANEWLSSIKQSLMNHIMRLRSFSLSTSARLNRSNREHEHIVNAVIKKNAEKAEALVKQHTKETGKFVVHMFLE